MPGAAGARSTTRALKDVEVRGGALGNSDNTKSPATSTIRGAAGHLVHAVLARVDLARETIAIPSAARNLNTPCWHLGPKWRRRFEIDGVPPQFHKRVARRIRVGAGHIRGPVAHGAGI